MVSLLPFQPKTIDIVLKEYAMMHGQVGIKPPISDFWNDRPSKSTTLMATQLSSDSIPMTSVSRKPDNTHRWGNDHDVGTARLQFNKTGLDQGRKYVVFVRS